MPHAMHTNTHKTLPIGRLSAHAVLSPARQTAIKPCFVLLYFGKFAFGWLILGARHYKITQLVQSVIVLFYGRIVVAPPVIFYLADKIFAVRENSYFVRVKILFHPRNARKLFFINVRIASDTLFKEQFCNAFRGSKRFLICRAVDQRFEPAVRAAMPTERIGNAFDCPRVVRNSFFRFVMCLSRTRSGI